MKMYLFKKTVYNCKHAILISLKKEEGKISLTERIQLLYHLLYCVYCRRFVKQSSILNHLGKNYIASIFTHPPHILSANIKEKLEQQIDSTGQ